METISKIRKEIYQLNQKRWALLEKIIKSRELLTASFYERYTKCSNPNCKCAKGELHGPFQWLYQKRKGQKLISTSCAADKVESAKKYAANYQIFKRNWKQVVELDIEINRRIEQIEAVLEVDAKEFIKKKEGENRGRKQKEGKAGDKESKN